ncbi:MAG: relaxase/mobilization nuclease domain-containing protein [Oscillatoria sp. PMC 1051.18]|nr:relaxase/mobilization nuclease domain-containing protein [Oscillatoria sp. PMC 1050.18]MEC5033094.1 relaxase/mobilization nuclease domain-containing protein [Oscillatoria sp. PMC 1051.18]
MISHTTTGSSFGGLFSYLLQDSKNSSIVKLGAFGRTPRELTIEFSNCALQRRSTKKPVKHIMIGFAPEDGEVSDYFKSEIGTRVLEELGYSRNQYAIINHHRNDPGHDWEHDHDHIHIVVNMITFDGQRIHDGWERYRTQEILRKLEKEFNLTQVASSWETDRRSPTHGQTQKYKKEQKEYEAGERDAPPEPPVSEKLQDLIETVTSDQPTMTEFVSRLQQQGVEVRPRITRNDIVQGISYCLDDVKFPGSKLGNASFPKLQSKRGVSFDPERDLAALKKAAASEMVEVEAAVEDSNQQVAFEVAEVAEVEAAVEDSNQQVTGDNDSSSGIAAADSKAADNGSGENNPRQFSSPFETADSGSDENNTTNTASDDSSNKRKQSEMVTEVAALTNAVLYLKETNHLEGSNFTASRQDGILRLWEKGNDKPIMTAIADHNNKTWNDTGESQLTPEIVNQFREHLSPALEKARALREQKRKQKHHRKKHPLQKRKHLGGGLEL